jgi:hypothetical protein
MTPNPTPGDTNNFLLYFCCIFLSIGAHGAPYFSSVRLRCVNRSYQGYTYKISTSKCRQYPREFRGI